MSGGTQHLDAFIVTDFQGFYPVGTCAVVYAMGREHCKRILRDELRTQGLGKDDPDTWTVEPLTPVPADPSARVLLNGDY